MVSDLDPATLAKFQKFQAMLAESPEIVAALNSPEIWALAARQAEKTNSTAQQHDAAEQQHQPVPEHQQQEAAAEAEPEYPMVGYGVSDDVSIMSEMTTPTVMTRQSVEEDEFYPEVDGKGSSSSGLAGNLRRISEMKIGVCALEDGSLPPPPPKSPNVLKMKSGHKMRRSTIRTKKTMMAPMSKIAEIDGPSVISHETGSTEPSAASKERPLKGNYTNWKPKPTASSSNASASVSQKQLEPHPFLGTSGTEAVRGTTRHSSFNVRTRRTSKGQRGVNRNRSMPTTIKPRRNKSAGESGNVSLSASASASSDSLSNVEDEDTSTKTSSSEFNVSTTTRNSVESINSATKNSVGSNSTPPITKNNTRKSRSKTSLSPSGTSFRKSLGTSGTTPNGRSINRDRSMPVKLNSNGSTSATSKSECLFFDDDDTNTKTSSTEGNSVSPSTSTNTSNEEKSTTPKEARSQSSKSQKSLTPPPRRTGRGLFQNTGSTKKPRGKSVPRMRLVPVRNKSTCSAESSPAKITIRVDKNPPTRTRSRSLSKYAAAAAAKASGDDKNSNSTDGNENDDDTSRPSEAESVQRMRMVPVVSKSICSAESSPARMTTRSGQNKQTRPRSRSLSKYAAAAAAKASGDDKNSNSTDGNENDDDTSRPSEAESVPRMRMVPVVSKSICSAESSPARMTIRSGQNKQTRPRSRSLSKYTAAAKASGDDKDKNKNTNDEKDDDTSRPSKATKTSTEDAESSDSKKLFTVVKSFHQTDDESDEINSTGLSISFRSSGSEDSKMVRSEEFLKGPSDHSSKSRSEDLPKSTRSSVTRRWKPPVVDNSALPPAFRLSSSNHSQKSNGRFSARVSSSSSSIKSEEQQESRSEEQKVTTSSSDDDEKECVQQTVRKSVKERSREVDKNSTASRPNPEEFKQYLSEFTHVIETTGKANTDRPSDYVGSSFTATRKKRQSKKKNLCNASETNAPRVEDWLGSGKAQKRTWRVKGT